MTMTRSNSKEQEDGPFLGILMLDTKFTRILGDAGNIDSYDTPARMRVVSGAGSLDIVKDGLPEEELIQAFCQAARELEAEGAYGIVSTCGFLISVQERISDVVGIPVMMSALSLYAGIHEKFPNHPIGILTASYISLGATALQAAGIKRNDVKILGMDDCAAFADVILRPKDQQSDKIDLLAIETAAIEKAMSLLEIAPDICAFL
ncbi:MAG: hypothetical protein N2B02_00960, partial [Amylibacter sp.]